MGSLYHNETFEDRLVRAEPDLDELSSKRLPLSFVSLQL